MKNFKVLLFLLACAIILCLSCTDGKKISGDDKKNNYETFQCVNSSPIQGEPPYDHLEMIKLETTPECLIKGFKKLEMNDSLVFFLDFDHLFVFNREGKFLRRIGEKGQGPDEYLELRTFFIDSNKKHIGLIDSGDRRKIFYYDFEGKLISSVIIPEECSGLFFNASLTDSNQLLIHYSMSSYPEDNMAYSLLDLNTEKPLGKFFSYNPLRYSSLYYTRNAIAEYEDEMHFVMPLCDTIYSYSQSSFSPKYVIKTPGKLASKEQIEHKTLNRADNILRLRKEGYFTGFTSIYETENKLILPHSFSWDFFLFDRNRKEGYNYSYTIEGDRRKVPFFDIVCSLPNDRFVAVEELEWLIQVENALKGDDTYVLQFKELVKNSEEDDNPILFVYGFNK